MKYMCSIIPFFFALFLSAQHYTGAPMVQGPDESNPLNIDYLFRGHFYASSPYDSRFNGFGGWGGSGNDFHPIDPAERPDSGLGIIAASNQYDSFYDQCLGFKVFLYNTTSDTAYFNAQDSRLSMKIQALDQKLEWRDIEYLPSSWCGNSYHMLYLPPEHYWEFTAPIFEGSFQTKLRIQVMATDLQGMETIEVYSNEYLGSINPEQFTNKEGYTPQGLMDPYED